MAELVTQKSSNEEFHGKPSEPLTPQENEQYWDIILANGTENAWKRPEIGTNTGPIPIVEQDEALLEAGEPEPLLEAYNEPEPQEVPELPAHEPAPPLHADTLHIPNVESNETVSMDDRFTNLLMVANHIIDRRQKAVESGDKSGSLDDLAGFQELYEQYKREGLEQASLDLVAKLVTNSYDLIDKVAASADEAPERSVSALEQVTDRDAELAALARPYVGDVVSIIGGGGDYNDGWLIVNDRFYEDISNDPDDEGVVNNPNGHHEYTVQKDGEQRTVRLEQLSLLADSQAADRIVPALKEIEERKQAVAPDSAGEEVTATAAQETVADDADDEDTEGIDDVTTPFETVKAADTPSAGVPHDEGEGGLSFDERLDNYMNYVEKNKQFWTENRKAVKEPHGHGFWRERWAKRKDPERQRKRFMLGVSTLVATSAAIGGVSAATHASHSPNPDSDTNGVTMADAFKQPAPDVLLPETEIKPPTTGPNQDLATRIPESLGGEKNAKEVFMVHHGNGPLDVVNRLGYTNDKWFAIAEKMYEKFGVDAKNIPPKDRILRKVGNDYRFDHTGELPGSFQAMLQRELKAES